MCRDMQCDSLDYPLLDYDFDNKKCVCLAHPCWDDAGVRHTCASEEHPHLAFSYDLDGKLHCNCVATPAYSSVFISLKKCPGYHCFDSLDENPLLDWDPINESCVCRSHPCWDLQGQQHVCQDPQYPH